MCNRRSKMFYLSIVEKYSLMCKSVIFQLDKIDALGKPHAGANIFLSLKKVPLIPICAIIIAQITISATL